MQEDLRKYPASLRKNLVLLYDNARSPSAKITQENLLDIGKFVLPYSSYSPDFPENDKKYSSEDQVKTFVENFLNLKPAEFHLRGINQLPDKTRGDSK